MNKDTKIISAFPGTGKTYVYDMFKDTDKYSILDSDSSTFSKKGNWPNEYINHIVSNIGKVDIIFISSHEEVRKMLEITGIKFNLIYPKKTLKKTYLRRYKKRKSPEAFIDYVDVFWDSWIESCEQQKGCSKIVLQKNQYLLDVIKQD